MTRKILLIANNFPPVLGGSSAVYDNLARSAAGAVDVLAPRLDYHTGASLPGWLEHDRQAPYRVRRLRLLRTILESGVSSGWPRVRLLLADLAIRLSVLGAILQLLRRERYAAICLGELLASGWMIPLLRRLPGVRVVVYVHGEEITTRDLHDPLKRHCRRLLQQADGIVVVSRFTRTAVLDLLGPEAAAKIVLIGNGVASGRFTPGPKRPDLAARYRVENAFVFISVCRLLEKKGIDNALRAFAAILREGNGKHQVVRFLIVGGGPYRAPLDALVAQLGIADCVAFTDLAAQEELVDMYRLGDVFVMPNRELADGDTEGFGLVFLEANACGLPVIAGRDGGSTDAVQHGVNGLVVDGRAVSDIADAMRTLRDDPARRERLRCGGLDLARKADWAQKAQMFLDFCISVEPAELPSFPA